MNTTTLFNRIKTLTVSFGAIIALTSMSHYAQATELSAGYQQLADAGYISYIDQDGTQRSQAAVDSDVITRSQGDLVNITLTQTFENHSKEVLVAQYVMPMPNPAALVDYRFDNSSYAGCSGDDSEVILMPGEKAVITVEFKLIESQLVAYHSADFGLSIEQLAHQAQRQATVVAQK